MRLIIFLAIFLFGVGSHAADLVVISSTSEALKPGSLLDGSNELSLAAGESVSLVTQQGKTLKIDGPYQGTPDTSANSGQDSLLDSLSKIVTESEQAASLAVFRSASTKKNPWTIKINKQGTYCLIDAGSTSLRRPKPLEPATMEIRAEDGSAATLEWKPDQRSASWPSNLELQDNANYSIYIDQSAAVEITVMLVPDDLASDAHRVVWLSEAGCEKQAYVLLDTL